MRLVVKPSDLFGRIVIPASKSHTIRAVFIGSLADGSSELINPLDSLDTQAAVNCARAFGATVRKGESWFIDGVGGTPVVPDDVVYAGNSGTSANFFMGLAANVDGYTVLSGDAQIRRRPVQPLIDELNNLGATVFSTRSNGFPPVVIRGKLKGGRTKVEGKTSIYTSALLMNCPMADGDSELVVENPKEKPYVEMTLRWLDSQGIKYQRDGFASYVISGGQRYRPFREQIPGDFSTATFFLCGAAITNSEVVLGGLDMNDTQGDKQVVHFLRDMGADIRTTPEGLVIKGGDLQGIELDLGDTPDALPALSVVGCFARGKTTIRNVISARWKETDRIKVMCRELFKLGAHVEELEDGLVIRESLLKHGVVDGHDDHRVVMAMAMAGLRTAGGIEIETAEALRVTVPNFVCLMQTLGASLSFEES
jgi:3-phosphoshikimate 1-carboxyvinyltransferase